ncbi:histone deacetylase 5 [Tanacetum coccineum]
MIGDKIEEALDFQANYVAAWDHILIPVAKEFKLDIILISAGFDAGQTALLTINECIPIELVNQQFNN